jgi:hypothetical protein
VVVRDERSRLARRDIRQAQERDVRRVDETTTLLDVLALRFFDTQDFYVGAL